MERALYTDPDFSFSKVTCDMWKHSIRPSVSCTLDLTVTCPLGYWKEVWKKDIDKVTSDNAILASVIPLHIVVLPLLRSENEGRMEGRKALLWLLCEWASVLVFPLQWPVSVQYIIKVDWIWLLLIYSGALENGKALEVQLLYSECVSLGFKSNCNAFQRGKRLPQN